MHTTGALRLSALCILAYLPLSNVGAQEMAPEASPDTSGHTAPDLAPTTPTDGITADWRASKLIGTTMTNVLGESVGRVEDVVIDGDGKVVAVLVSVGGFLGLGETSVAIGLRHLVITPADADNLEVKTSLSRRAIEQAARLEPGDDRSVAQ